MNASGGVLSLWIMPSGVAPDPGSRPDRRAKRRSGGLRLSLTSFWHIDALGAVHTNNFPSASLDGAALSMVRIKSGTTTLPVASASHPPTPIPSPAHAASSRFRARSPSRVAPAEAKRRAGVQSSIRESRRCRDANRPGSSPGRRLCPWPALCTHPTPIPSPGPCPRGFPCSSHSVPQEGRRGQPSGWSRNLVRAARRLPARGDILAASRLLSNLARPMPLPAQTVAESRSISLPPAWSHRQASSRGLAHMPAAAPVLDRKSVV